MGGGGGGGGEGGLYSQQIKKGIYFGKFLFRYSIWKVSMTGVYSMTVFYFRKLL